jgi:uncharacterized protein (TIGR02145 family)
MKTLILSLLVLTLASISNAQNVNIPDANFKSALISAGVDTNNDGEISYAEAEAITSLAVIEKSISDMTGIEAFVNLDTLNCSNNQLTSLNVSDNTALKELHCDSNNLASLDISSNIDLIDLWCMSNQLTSLDVSDNTALKTLICENNQLTSLDVSNKAVLYFLDCNNNQLTSLNVSGCITLFGLHCFNNQLTSLDVSGLTALFDLWCNNNQLTSLDASGCIALEWPSYGGNPYINLDFSGCTALIHFTYWEGQITSLDVSGCTALTELYCPGNQLTSLDFSGCTALTRIICSSNQLTSLDVSGCKALTELDCSENPLTSLEVSNNTALGSLQCNNNQLTSLDISNNNVLTFLRCSNNQLTNLDVSNNNVLRSLQCNNNQLTSLDVSNNTALTELFCGSNPLTNLNISKNEKLLTCDSEIENCEAIGGNVLDLSYMPTLYEVCVWELPFPPAGKDDLIDTTGSPNIYFTTDCSVTDIDGNVYNTITIGTQVWMAENLKYLPSVVGPDTDSYTTPCYYVYGYNGTVVADAKATANYTTYGVLYNWLAAMNGAASSTSNPSGVQGVCPTGWHLPSDAEWTQLTDYLGGTSDAGGKLKENGTTHWNSPNTGATNETGFTALPGGDRFGLGGYFEGVGDWGLWWCATEDYTNFPDYAWFRGMAYDSSSFFRGSVPEALGFSVRCVNDNKASITNSIISEEVILYPNPATDKLYLKNRNYANTIVMIFDLQGKQVLSKEMDSNPIDISCLEKGIYVVKLAGSENVMITKFIKE